MRKIFRLMTLTLALTLCSMHALADTAGMDTIYFYKSWMQMLTLQPEACILNTNCEAVTPYEIYIESFDEELSEMISENYIAASLGDSIWLINSDYLKRNFKGDVKGHNGFVPLYFNEKVAFITSYGPMSVKEVLFGNGDDPSSYNVCYYYIDFLSSRVERVTAGYLSRLLEDYHDLQMRYEGMKDYKKSYMIEEYFFKYIDRATEDVMHPYILDLVKE